MSKNLLGAYENGFMDDFLDDQAVSAITSKRNAVAGRTGGQRDQKRLRNTYIGAAKKGAASKIAREMKASKNDEKPTGRREASAVRDLQNEICGKSHR